MKALNRFEELGLTEKIFTAAAIIGLLVIGGMSASMVSINPVVAIGSGDNAIKLIDVINGIMPKMLSLFTTLGIYRLLKKGTKPNTILLGIIVVVCCSLLSVFSEQNFSRRRFYSKMESGWECGLTSAFPLIRRLQ